MNLQSPFGSEHTGSMEQSGTSEKTGKALNLFQKRDSVLVVLLVVCILVAGGLGLLYYKEKQKAVNPTVAAGEEANFLKRQVEKHILLPDEEPGIATVVDVDKLRESNPEFYADAKNGHKLLVYKNKAILYDPEKDRIVNVAPVVTTDTETTDPSSVPGTNPSN
ncbi:hypothetical protein JW796_01125 [Candidatus Dojkabacteria bacterium]|nr:hypothetical protein [Candidatus Dojkabacteria bacterium]